MGFVEINVARRGRERRLYKQTVVPMLNLRTTLFAEPDIVGHFGGRWWKEMEC